MLIRSAVRLSEESGAKLKCLGSLLLTDPEDNLRNIRRTKGNRANGTCEWILSNRQYVEWVEADSNQLLRLIGGPGMGKTMIASYLVDQFTKNAEQSGSTLLAFFLCDASDENRKTATAVLRGLLVQLLRQQPSFFQYVQPIYDEYGRDDFESVFCMNFHSLWEAFEAVLQFPVGKSIVILIDALDEVVENSQIDLAKAFDRYFRHHNYMPKEYS